MVSTKSISLAYFLISLLLCLGYCEEIKTSSQGKVLYTEKIKELWLNRADKNMGFYEFLQKEIIPRDAMLKMETDAKIPEEFFSQESNVSSSNFPCKVFHNHTNPKSVHRLKPSDVDLVAAMGDSITAAFAAKSRNILEIFVEFRGVSWSIGGDKTLDDVTTLPNIIKKYNADVDGFSVKTTPPKIRIPWRSHLNFAVSGAISIDLPGQARKLIEDLKTYDNYQDGWKVLTMWIGGNDLCAYCKNDKHTVAKYIGGIRDALDLLHNEVPKMFVNLVQILDVTRLGDIKSNYCKPLHYILCYCGTSDGEEMKKKVSQVSIEYQQEVSKLIKTGRYDTREDFTVVTQPFFEQTSIPKKPDGSADMSYIAPDCFHFSEKGHRAAALALWNSMIEPVGKKRMMWSKGEQFECPSSTFPYFYTNKNSISTEESQALKHQEAPLSMDVNNSGEEQMHTVNAKKTSSATAIFLTVSICIALALVAVVFVLKRRERRNEALNVQDTKIASYNSL